MPTFSTIQYKSLSLSTLTPTQLDLSTDSNTLVTLTVLLRGITMAQTVTFYDQNLSELFAVGNIQGVATISWSNAPLGYITIKDSTYSNYEVDAIWEFITADNSTELAQLKSVSQFIFTPVFIPSSGGGAVTSVANSDSTLTISPTTGAVIASINLANANTWTAIQTFGNNISIGGIPFSISGSAKGDLIYNNGTDWTNLAVGSGSEILGVSGGIPAWIAAPATGVTSLDSLTGAVTTGSPNSTLSIGTSTQERTFDLNLTHANSWTGVQSFGNTYLNLGGATFDITKVTALATGDLIIFDGTNWINLAVGTGSQVLGISGGLPAWVAAGGGGAVSSVSNSDGTLTISPTTGAVVASLNHNHANTWTQLQSFNSGTLGILNPGGNDTYTIVSAAITQAITLYLPLFTHASDYFAFLNWPQTWGGLQTFGNNISLGGATLDVGKNTALATGDILYYDGTNLINLGIGSGSQVLGISGGVPAWVAGGAGGGPTLTRLTSDTGPKTASSYSSSGLTVALSANTNYMVKFYVYMVLASGNTGSNFEIHALPSGAALTWCKAIAVGPAASGISWYGLLTAVTSAIFGAGDLTYSYAPSWGIEFDLLVTVGSTSGTLQLDYASDGSHNATIKAGSWSEASVIT